MTAVQLTARERHWILLLLVVVVVVRLATLPAYPLLDPTESRYAEIARKMLETGNWLVPQVDYGVPFWGKPPLSMWLSAAAMAVLGVNEFAARLPSFLLLVGCGALVYRLASQRAGSGRGAMDADGVCDYRTCVHQRRRRHDRSGAGVRRRRSRWRDSGKRCTVRESTRRAAGLVFFVGLAVGLLAKGPVARRADAVAGRCMDAVDGVVARRMDAPAVARPGRC